MIEGFHTPTYSITIDDIRDLSHVVMSNMFFSFNGTIYKQVSGLPMGTSISGPLAITYMNKIERQFLSTNPPLSIYARYVDDIFILTQNEEEANNIFRAINDIDTHINFTIEYPTSDKELSLLYFSVQITETTKDKQESRFSLTQAPPFHQNRKRTIS